MPFSYLKFVFLQIYEYNQEGDFVRPKYIGLEEFIELDYFNTFLKMTFLIIFDQKCHF